MFTALSLLGGLIFVALGSASLMRGSVGFAQLAGLPTFLIGLVIVSFGTSTPQLFTALLASQGSAAKMALATVVGASIFNIFVTLGVVALRGGAVHLNQRLWVRGSFSLALLTTASTSALVYFALAGLAVPPWFGAITLLTLAAYVAAAHAYDHKHPIPLPVLKETKKLHPAILAGLFVAGLFALILGANLLIDTTSQLNATHGFNQIFLGLTVLAAGTALPQLATSLKAFQNNEHSLLLANLIGNTIFNLLGVCGLLFMLHPVMLQPGALLTSFGAVAAATIAFAVFTHPSMRRFKRAEAILFLLAYITYLAYILHSF